MVYTQPATAVYTTKSSTSKFDQSWSAVIGALSDQGVRITTQDRGAGIIQGTRYGIEVTGNIRTQADNSVHVQFDTSGETKSDPQLIQRITDSYNRRMGR
ncbi:hypothetical protein [Methyloprofundus sp.]|uniref:hypothetical protein n=1 Tax=Methyloprofundus sp. TaxID=2020875 RepID=UPI003D150646